MMTQTTTLNDFNADTPDTVSPPFDGVSPDARYAAQDHHGDRCIDPSTGQETWGREVTTDMLVAAGATPGNDTGLASYVQIRKHRQSGGWVSKVTEQKLESYTTRSGETYLKTKGWQRNTVCDTRSEAVAYVESRVDAFERADVRLTTDL